MIKRIGVASTTAFFVFLNTGCIHDDPSPSYKKETVTKLEEGMSVKKIPPIIKQNGTPSTECKEEVETTKKTSDCDRGTISKDELTHAPKKVEKYNLRSIRGKKITIIKTQKGYKFPDFQGKIILLEMFGKNCPHCINMLPIIKKVRRRYRNRLEVIAIQSQERMDRYTAASYINQHRIRYPIIEGADATNLQYSVQDNFGWRGILPYIMIIKDGVVKYIHEGEVSYKDLVRDIDEVL